MSTDNSIQNILLEEGYSLDEINEIIDSMDHEQLEQLHKVCTELEEIGSAVEFNVEGSVYKLHWRPQPRQARFLEACGVDPTGS